MRRIDRVGDAVFRVLARLRIGPAYARAAGQVQLSRGRTKKTCSIRQALPQEAGRILKQYVQIASATRPYFAASADAPVSAFVAEADRHPVFELTPLAVSRPQ
jgi:hypothetical protein